MSSQAALSTHPGATISIHRLQARLVGESLTARLRQKGEICEQPIRGFLRWAFMRVATKLCRPCILPHILSDNSIVPVCYQLQTLGLWDRDSVVNLGALSCLSCTERRKQKLRSFQCTSCPDLSPSSSHAEPSRSSMGWWGGTSVT